MEPSTLKPFTLDPRSWESWVPADLLETYIYDSQYPMAIGYAEGPGWFVLTKDPEERIVYCEHNAEPTSFSNPAHAQWGSIGRPGDLPDLRGMVASAELLIRFFGADAHALYLLEIGKALVYQAHGREFRVKRIYPDLYRVHSIRRVAPQQPGPATA